MESYQDILEHELRNAVEVNGGTVMSDNFDRLVEKGRRDFRIGMAILTETIIICCLVIIVFDPF